MKRELAPVTRQSTPCHGGESSCTPSLVGGRGVVESLSRAYTHVHQIFFNAIPFGKFWDFEIFVDPMIPSDEIFFCSGGRVAGRIVLEGL
jgi:hypothetical protein